jgi:hypothetical protein
MGIESIDDLAIFLGVDDFGTEVKFGNKKFNGIFDNDFVEVDAGGGVSFATQQPRLVARSIDCAILSEDSQLVISGTTYKVKVIQPDGTGMTTLVLEKQ